MIKLQGERITVIGLGRSGFAAAKLLHDLGARVTVSENGENEEIKKRAGELTEKGIHTEIGGHSQEVVSEAALIVTSPGVPLDAAPLQLAREKGIEVIGELELAARFCKGRTIAVTGTNGKSTTVTLIAEIFKANGRRALVAGNIGTPMCSLVSRIKEEDVVVLEVSRFQLETIKDFRPFISVLLNLTADQLDRYGGSFSSYLRMKKRIFTNQDREDFTVLNRDDTEVRNLSSQTKARAVFFSQREELREGAFLKAGKSAAQLKHSRSTVKQCRFSGSAVRQCRKASEDRITVRWEEKEADILPFEEIGVHNLENALAATAVATILGLNPVAIGQGLRGFSGLEHRLEFVREIRGVKFINDSKGTNVGAVAKSLESLTGPVFLIAGGRDKEADYSVLKKSVQQRVKALVLLGEAKAKIKKSLAGTAPIKEVDSIEEAVKRCYSLAQPGDTVLLSPACSSFDMFKDFEERGRIFKEAVKGLHDTYT